MRKPRAPRGASCRGRCRWFRADGIGLGGLADAEVAAAVEALGEEVREELWHVLDDEDGQRRSCGQSGEQNIESGGAPGGDADGNDGRGGRDGLWPKGGADGLTERQNEGRARRTGKDGARAKGRGAEKS